LQAANDFLNGKLVSILNNNEAPNLTVCPLCRVDDFVHIAGCELSLKVG
jgi:hypothetical protein